MGCMCLDALPVNVAYASHHDLSPVNMALLSNVDLVFLISPFSMQAVLVSIHISIADLQ